MSGEETWIARAEKITLFRNQGKGSEAVRLLEISPTNRIIIDRHQALVLLAARTGAMRFRSHYSVDKSKWAWMDNMCNILEEHQLTFAGTSREQFMKVAIAQFQGMVSKAKNEVENFVSK